MSKEDFPGKVVTLCYRYQLFVTIKLRLKEKLAREKEKIKAFLEKTRKTFKNIKQHGVL